MPSPLHLMGGGIINIQKIGECHLHETIVNILEGEILNIEYFYLTITPFQNDNDVLAIEYIPIEILQNDIQDTIRISFIDFGRNTYIRFAFSQITYGEEYVIYVDDSDSNAANFFSCNLYAKYKE